MYSHSAGGDKGGEDQAYEDRDVGSPEASASGRTRFQGVGFGVGLVDLTAKLLVGTGDPGAVLPTLSVQAATAGVTHRGG